MKVFGYLVVFQEFNLAKYEAQNRIQNHKVYKTCKTYTSRNVYSFILKCLFILKLVHHQLILENLSLLKVYNETAPFFQGQLIYPIWRLWLRNFTCIINFRFYSDQLTEFLRHGSFFMIFILDTPCLLNLYCFKC